MTFSLSLSLIPNFFLLLRRRACFPQQLFDSAVPVMFVWVIGGLRVEHLNFTMKKCHQHQRQSNCENIFPSCFAFALRVSLSLSPIICHSGVALATLYLASGKSINQRLQHQQSKKSMSPPCKCDEQQRQIRRKTSHHLSSFIICLYTVDKGSVMMMCKIVHQQPPIQTKK